MKAFVALVRAGVVMLRRNRTLLISSLGLALISIFVFGWLFGSGGTPKLQLGVTNNDVSPLGARVLAQLRQSDSLNVYTGTQDEEIQSLRDGHRNAVLVLPATFGADLRQGHTALQVYYDESNPIMEANARAAVQSIIASLNAQMTGQSSPVTLHEQAVSVRNLRQIDWLTPGMLGMLLMWANLSIGALLVQWRQQGILRRLAATPVRPGMLMATQMLARLVLSVAQGAILIAVAMLVFHVQIVGSWGALLLAVALGALTMMALGFVAGSFTKTSEAAQSVMFLVSFPMMFLGGSYFPTDSAPAFLMPVIKAMPLTYLNDALRQIINNGAGLVAIQSDLLVLAAWMVAALLLSARTFRWS
ncbi:MAG TPA: ABC transporter permease [Ktedonobacterales bacterium]|nr:ABC transporter permease [Ktedonobacterales bacterium]